MGGPLLAKPDRSDYELYRLEDGLLSLGPYKHVTEVPVPSWREFLARTGHPISTRADLEQIEEEWFLSQSELDQEADGYAWEMHWERHEGPAARAYKLLEKL